MKYCDNCLHFIKSSKSCKIFGANYNYFTFHNNNLLHKNNIYYFSIEYVRFNNQLCGIDAKFHTNILHIFQNKNFNK